MLGLEQGLLLDERKMLFLRVGGAEGMVVLQEDAGDWPKQHFALAMDEGDLAPAALALKEHGVESNGPVYHEWMPARSLYFNDPDGHELEFCAAL